MSPAPSRLAVVYNPTKVGIDEVRRLAEGRASRHGWTDPVFYETTEEDPGTGQAARAAADGVGLVIACGGDGTVRSVAQGLLGTSVPMGVVPLGTGNLLARNLGVPLDDVDRALRVAMSGRSRAIDLGEVHYTDGDGVSHDDVFLVMLGAGMDADMIAGTDDKLKARVGWLAYVGAFANTLLRGHRIRVEYALDDGSPIQTRARTLLVANCGMLQAGMVLLPDAVIDDGLLDVLALRAKGPLGWAQAGAVLAHHTFQHRLKPILRRNSTQESGKEEHRTRPLDFRQGVGITARVLEKPAAFQIDGEDCGTVTEFSARIKRRGLTVRVAV
ncbi:MULTISPECIES: diacylglycerol/lipid kinase family protein [Dietzia]|uniref:Diacylglycerol kinase family protein n=1 Tax=Dietzia maris TaxID=37915 RepID=A0ABT8H238_9ACTN|nr:MULTISPECIES: diacylglycerol kinase family protein [Dietzia]MBB0994027.1 diacylglycerol kinase [Dietzia sp. SLG510A3-40A3]MBB1008482.1 diacylglycerol kinase [Dietzia sp. SLG510A3-3B2-2]ODQ85470.1 diacylglycerol kinase [Dietzia alimentaria]MDJ0422586.1 diacylglycerol kinase family protein [Dietzia kunjamensis]MDN4506529.1 diacylglycerol kinase family protein [Dietzia maris]